MYKRKTTKSLQTFNFRTDKSLHLIWHKSPKSRMYSDISKITWSTLGNLSGFGTRPGLTSEQRSQMKMVANSAFEINSYLTHVIDNKRVSHVKMGIKILDYLEQYDTKTYGFYRDVKKAINPYVQMLKDAPPSIIVRDAELQKALKVNNPIADPIADPIAKEYESVGLDVCYGGI